MKNFIVKTIAAIVLFLSGSIFSIGYSMVKGVNFNGKR